MKQHKIMVLNGDDARSVYLTSTGNKDGEMPPDESICPVPFAVRQADDNEPRAALLVRVKSPRVVVCLDASLADGEKALAQWQAAQPPEPAKRRRGRPRIHPPKPKLSEAERAKLRVNIARKAAQASAAARKAKPKKEYRTTILEKQVYAHLRVVADARGGTLSETVESALAALELGEMKAK